MTKMSAHSQKGLRKSTCIRVKAIASRYADEGPIDAPSHLHGTTQSIPMSKNYGIEIGVLPNLSL